MKTHRISSAILFLGVLAALAMILYPSMAHANQVDPVPSVANSTASAGAKASSNASSAIDLSLVSNPAGGSVKAGDSYAFVSGSATPLPPGLCPKGESSYVQVFWGLFTLATSSTRTEMECLDKVLAMLRETAQKPVVVNYVAPEPKVEPKPAEQARMADPAPLAPYCYKSPPKAAPKKKVHKQCKS